MEMTARRGGHFSPPFAPAVRDSAERRRDRRLALRRTGRSGPKIGKFQYRDVLGRKIIVQETSIILKFDKI